MSHKKNKSGNLNLKALPLPEARIEVLFESIPTIVWTTDLKLDITLSVGPGLKTLGLKPNELVGKNLLDIFERNDPDYLPISTHYQALEGESSAYEMEFWDRILHTYVEPLRDKSGEIIGVIGISIDITERKKAEEALRKRANLATDYQSALLELAKIEAPDLESALKQITKIDAETMNVERVSVWFFNPNRSAILCDCLFKKSENKFEKGTRLEAKDFPNYFKALEESRTIAAADALSDSRTNEFSEVYLKPLGITSMMDVPVRLQGRIIGILCHEHVGPGRKWDPCEEDFAGSVADMISLAIESSERKRAEEALKKTTEELIRSNKELEQFAYLASHDLQEPLHKIIAFGDRLESLFGSVLAEKGRDYIQRMQKASLRLRTLVEDLLRISRITTAAKPFEPVDLNKILEEVLSDVEIRLKESGGKIEIGPLPVVHADPLQMHQLFQNLISNSLKFCKKDPPRISIKSRKFDNRLTEVSVSDNGIGFNEEYAEQIFQPFKRLHSQAEYEGSGIGLMVCQKIVQRHGGEITAKSEEGKGATFKIILPLET